MGMTGSTFQLVNGVVLLTAFAGVRLFYGAVQVCCICIFLKEMYRRNHPKPAVVIRILPNAVLDPRVRSPYWRAAGVRSRECRAEQPELVLVREDGCSAAEAHGGQPGGEEDEREKAVARCRLFCVHRRRAIDERRQIGR